MRFQYGHRPRAGARLHHVVSAAAMFHTLCLHDADFYAEAGKHLFPNGFLLFSQAPRLRLVRVVRPRRAVTAEGRAAVPCVRCPGELGRAARADLRALPRPARRREITCRGVQKCREL